MPTHTSHPPGCFNYVDLMSHGMAEARRFYTDLFGWQAAEQDTQGGPPYAMFMNGQHCVAGLGEAPEEVKARGVPAAWNTYIAVADATSAVEKVVGLGGTVMMPPMPVMEAGWMAVCTDPEGAAFSLWQAKQHIGADLTCEPFSLCWNELNVRAMDRAMTFYGALFGWTFADNPAAPGQYKLIEQDGEAIGGILQMTEEWGDMPAHWMVYFAVADLDAILAHLPDLGGKTHTPVIKIDQGRFCVISDAQGAVFTVMQMAAA